MILNHEKVEDALADVTFVHVDPFPELEADAAIRCIEQSAILDVIHWVERYLSRHKYTHS